jgi:N-acyl-L-homoserine lactone synthetase
LPRERSLTTARSSDYGQVLDGIHRLRYQVYCIERQFLDLAAYPQGREQDEYDQYAVHFAATDPGGRVVGTARLVLDSPIGFPLERRRPRLFPEFQRLPRARTGEISRLILAHGHRGGTIREPEILFGLFKALHDECRRLRLDYVLASMEPRLCRLLRRLGFPFGPIGEVMDYFGPVTPYYAQLDALAPGVRAILDHQRRLMHRAARFRYQDVRTDHDEAGLTEEQWIAVEGSDGVNGSLTPNRED